MRKRLLIVMLFVVVVAAGLYATSSTHYPPLQDGDLIFHTSTSTQSAAILAATASPYTHMGIIKNDGRSIMVIEASATVGETALEEWINRGVMKRVAIYRDPTLSSQQAQDIMTYARSYHGKPYDVFFSFDNDAIYCSELPYLAYRKAGIDIGKVQKLAELNFDNMLVRKLVEQRWQRHAECKARNYDFKQCYAYLLEQILVTPASIAKDNRFQKIYSDFPL